MYESPITAFLNRMNFEYDGEILRAVQSVNVTVDKDELMKALRYDRDQYEKGYRDATEEVGLVRCKECRFFMEYRERTETADGDCRYKMFDDADHLLCLPVHYDDFCSKAVKRGESE